MSAAGIEAARGEIAALTAAIGAILRRIDEHERGPLTLQAISAIRLAGSEVDEQAPRRRRAAP